MHIGAQQLLTQIEEERYRIEEKKRAKRLENTPKQISNEERHIEELLEQARALLQEEKFAEATFTLHELFSIDPNHSGARRLEESIRQTEQAKAELLRIQAKQAQEEQHLHELAKLQQRVEEQRRQQANLRQQIEHKPPHKRYYYIAAAVIALGAALFGGPKLLDFIFPKKASIAIVQFMNAPHDTSNIDLFDALPVLLAEDFSQCEHVTVIAPSSSLLFTPDQAHFQKITSLLPTSYLVMGTIQENRTGYTLQIRLFNPDQQKIIYVGSVEGQISELSEMRLTILQKVMEKMEIKSKLPEISRISNGIAFEQYLNAFHLLQLNSNADIDSAKTLLLTAVQIDPSFGLAYGTLADLQLHTYDETNNAQLLQSASEYAQRALRCSPTIGLAYKVLAICARLQQNYNVALSSITQCLVLLPQDPDCYRELAFLSMIAGKYDDAPLYASNALQYDPINPKSHFTIALAQQMKHDYSAAENAYKRAQLFGEDEEALTINYIQNIWLAEGQYDRVIKYFQQKLQTSPKEYRYYYWIGRAYQLSLQISTAQKWLKDGLTIAQQAIEANHGDAEALSYVGLFHSRLGNFSDGEEAMNNAIQIKNNWADILFRSAELYSIQRDEKKAFTALEKAIRCKYDYAELLNTDFSIIAPEPEFLQTVTRKMEDKWPMK